MSKREAFNDWLAQLTESDKVDMLLKFWEANCAPVNDGEAAMQAACCELPEGYNLEIGLELGAGWVDIIDCDGNRLDFEPDVDGGMTPRIRAATEFAIEHAKERS